MSVNKEDIDFKKAFEKSAGVTKPAKQPNAQQEEDTDFKKAFESSLKKKDTPSVQPSKELPDGGAAVPGTTNTIKWEDNPLNPVKAINDYEAKRDKTPEILFKDSDNEQLNTLLAKHKVAPAAPVTKPLSWIEAPGQPQMQSVAKAPMQIKYEDAVNLENAIKAQIENYKDTRQRVRGIKKSKEEENAEKDLQEVQILKRKAATELVVNGDKEIEVNRRTNEIGNSFNQFMADLISLNQPIKGKKINVKETEDKVMKMPTQFLTGINMLKLTEPAEYERVTEAIANGLPVSASQTAKITALGLNIEQAKLERDILKAPVSKQERQKFDDVSKALSTIKPAIDKYEEMIKTKQSLSAAQLEDYNEKINQYNQTFTQNKSLIEKINSIDGAFAKKATELQEARKRNLIDNPEVLRAFISDGVAEKLDEIGKIKQGADMAAGGKKLVSDFMFGHTWNYSPEQIKWASEQYLKEQGIDPTTKQAQDAIKFLQENEGIMIGENSIAKAGGFRELGEGIIEPITGTAKSIKDRYRSFNDIYAESQSQGNVDVAKKRLASEDTGIRSVVNDVLKGTGQFASQAAIMYATSGGIGAIAEGILGKSGVEWLAQAKAANIKPVAAFDDATANLAAGKFLYGIKDPMAVFTTSYAMSYDGNLKAALSYTSDNTLAKRAAMFNASMEGATELFLSPLEIAQGIIHKFSKNQTKDLLKILSDKSLKDEPGALKEYVGKFVRGVLGTSKVAGAEIGEELVTQISDYVTNMYLNPDSDSFKNRDLKQELMTTAYQTGLTMAVPAILNGIGAMKTNSFSKASLMIAAQNRQKMVDDLNKDLAAGRISPDQANQRIQLINTAAEANARLPKKASGAPLNTDEKANYIWSLTTEAYMDKKMGSLNDAAAKEIWKDKILKQQEYRKKILGLSEMEPEVPEYTIDDKPVGREEFLRTIEEKPDGNYVVTGDEEAQAALRKVGGVDDKTDSEVTTAVIEIGGKMYEGKNHAEAILKAKADGQDISNVDRKAQGKFKLSDGTIITREQAKKKFGADRAEQLIEQDEAADNANKEYRKSDKDLVAEVQDKGVPGYEKTGIMELKEQSLGAPASLKNQFDDEELVVDLISRNTEEKIQNAINWQTERLDNANLSELELKEVDKHIKLLELGLEKQKEFVEQEDATGYNSKIENVNVDDLEFTELEDGNIEESKAEDVEKYAEKFRKGETPPPIIVGINAEGKRVVIDGHRRVLAAKKTGVKTLKAIVRDRVTENNKGITYPEIQMLEAEEKKKTGLSKLEQLKLKKGIKPPKETIPPTDVVVGKAAYDERAKLVDDIKFEDYPNDKEGEISLIKDGKKIATMDLHYGSDGLVHIKWVKVNKDFQGKGLSLLLYGKAAEIAKQKGMKGVGSGFVTHSTSKTKEIYKHFNVTELGESKGSMEEGVQGRKVILHSLKEPTQKQQSGKDVVVDEGVGKEKAETSDATEIEKRRQEDLETTNKIGEDKLKDGRETTKKIVESLKQRYSPTSVKGIIIRILEKLIDFNKYSTIVDSEYINGRNASGQATWFGMMISQETLDGILAGKEYEVHTFIHEFIHGFTTNKIVGLSMEGYIPGYNAGLSEKERNAIKQLQRIFDKVKAANPKSKEYGFKNLDEFIAEAFSNESFQYTLKGIASEGKKSNLFKDLINAIGDILYEQLERWAKRFGKEIPDKNTVTGILEDVFAWAEDLIDQNNKLAYLGTAEEINAKYDAEIAEFEPKKADEGIVDKTPEIVTTKNKQNEQPAKKQQTPGERPGKSSTKSGKSVKPEKIKTFKKRAKATIKSPLYLKALAIESTDPRVQALQYFIAGGRIHRQAFEKLFGGNKVSGRKSVSDEIKAHFQLQGRNGARSIDQLGHNLWDEADEQTQEKYDSQDFSNAVESVLLDHNSRTSMAEELAKYEEKGDEDWQNYYDQAHEGLEEDEQNQVDKAISILEGLSDEEIQQILDTEEAALADSEFLEQLSNQYDNPVSKEQAEKDKKLAEIEKDKQDKINKATKPEIQPEEQTKIEADLALTSEANRQQLDDIKQKLYSLRELVKCLWQ